MSFHEGALDFARGVTTVRVPASGVWSRTALVPVDLVKDLLRRRKALPETFVLVRRSVNAALQPLFDPLPLGGFAKGPAMKRRRGVRRWTRRSRQRSCPGAEPVRSARSCP